MELTNPCMSCQGTHVNSKALANSVFGQFFPRPFPWASEQFLKNEMVKATLSKVPPLEAMLGYVEA